VTDTLEPAGADDAMAMIRLVKGAKGHIEGSVLRYLRAAGFDALRLAHLQVFENLDRDGTHLTTLSERAAMSHQAMGELVVELVDQGYLERIADPEDGRSRLVRPTAAGLALLDRGRQHVVALREQWERSLGDATVAQVLEALTALARVCEVDSSADPPRRGRSR
jgi:DNA-binding MarR family transcriptional regulator